MRTGSKITLGTLLGLVNGYFLGVWRQDWIGANEVARQWIRLIIPAMMLIASAGIFVVVWIADWATGRKMKTSNQASHATSEPAPGAASSSRED